MKKHIAVITAIFMTLSLVFCGCSSKKEEDPATKDTKTIGTVAVSGIFTDLATDDKNGFDASKTTLCNVGGLLYSIPDYYSLIEGSANSFSAKDEKGESAISFNYFTKGEQPLNEETIKSVIPNLLNFEDLKISETGSAEVCGFKAYFGRVTFSDVSKRSTNGVVLMVDNTESGVYDAAMFFQTAEAEFDYGSDYAKIVESVTVDKEFKAAEAAPAETSAK